MTVLVVLLGVVIMVKAQLPAALQVKELSLSNGMKVWLNEDHSQPKVFGAVVVNAGAKDCPNTGIAHYFEHIMFKGTEEIGTVDYEAEKPWLDSIAAQYDRLAVTTDAAERNAIQKHINDLSQKAGEYAIPNEFNRLISLYGGSNLNAGTSYDLTFYHNTFTPQYMEQWCQLNSDRLIRPVFRLFQGELETVYEEKNMYADDAMSTVQETLFKELFGTQPYAYPVIGSTENLKNPKLSDMKQFYDKYYVGSNMGLVLCGDFEADSIKPLLERTFGRITKGVKPTRQLSPMPDITQERTVELKMPVPIVSMEMLTFKAPTDYEADANALDVALKILYNEKAGLLDSLVNSSEMMAVMGSRASLNDAGMIMLMLVPNLLSKTEKAEAKLMAQIDRLVNGDFSDEMFNTQKQEIYREALTEMETITDRSRQMVMVMSSGHSWQDYMNKLYAIGQVTKADVMAAAKRYLKAPFVRFKKKYGEETKDKVSQPGYKPVTPKHRNDESAYAKRLAEMPVPVVEPRHVDFQHDAVTTPLGGKATLYTVGNPVNDLFHLNIRYDRGEKADPLLEMAMGLLDGTDTDSLTRQQFNAALQALGASMEFGSDDDNVSISVKGKDENLEPTMLLVSHLLNHAKPTAKQFSQMLDGIKASEKAFGEDNTDVMSAMLAKVCYGENSPLLTRATYKEVKKITADQLLTVFDKVKDHACDITYSGTLPATDVERIVRATLPVTRSTIGYIDYGDDLKGYQQPEVWIYDMKNARQTLFFTYEQIKALPTIEERVPLNLATDYIGGGMASILFQEVREFRSMAYTTSSLSKKRPRMQAPQSPTAIINFVGTQGDKAMSAISLVDSLLHDLPMLETNFNTVRQEIIYELNNNYPSFRGIGDYIVISKAHGFREDPGVGVAALYRKSTLDDVRRFYEQNIKNNAQHRILCIVGNKKKLNLKELQKYGRIVFVKQADLFKK